GEGCVLQRNASSHCVKVTQSGFSSNFEFADDHAAARQRGIPHHRLSKTLFGNVIARRQRLALQSSRQWSASPETSRIGSTCILCCNRPTGSAVAMHAHREPLCPAARA
ncbi:hypothetical protein L2218_03890, partial [Xanthomonas perforans]|uniref:hypothetical protein n=1 Tax=Xanthomonas perforans TaxID=442694 RepID=UPI001F22A2C0